MNVFDRAAIFIPAFQKNHRFQNDLLRKLDGVSLIQRAIDKARLLDCDGNSIHLLTDSEEVALIGKRNNVGVFSGSSTSWGETRLDDMLRHYLTEAERKKTLSILLSPYAPLLEFSTLQLAVKAFLGTEFRSLKPVRNVKPHMSDNYNTQAVTTLGNQAEVHQIDSGAFTLFRPGELLRDRKIRVSVLPWDVGDDAFEIHTLQDWWVSEKLLQRKRVVFRVIGNRRVGMGHIYRTLALAHDLHDHEVLFVTDEKNKAAVEAIVKRDYWLGVYASTNVIDEILHLRPDMVINDILDTRKTDIERLRAAGILTVSFEDLGSGARYTDLTINEIYDVPEFEADHVLWGKEYFFLRDEFQNARPHRFKNKVNSVMATFGGTDQHDLARKTFHATREMFEELGIFLQIVTGPGYRGYDRLAREIQGNEKVSITHGSEVISSIMEQVQVAVTSNGRTVYELAHMNIPAIVISQHDREVTHAFASEENGFLPLGLYYPGKTELALKETLKELVLNTDYRKMLHRRLLEQKFVENKGKVISRLNALLSGHSTEASR